MSDAMEPRTDMEPRTEWEHQAEQHPGWLTQTGWERSAGPASEPERLVDDSGAIQRIVEQLRNYEADVERRRQEDRRRADEAARAMDEMRGRLNELEAAQGAAQEAAGARAAAIMEAEREALRQREHQFVSGLRTYLADIEQAQKALLSVARQALHASIDAGTPTPGEVHGDAPPALPEASAPPADSYSEAPGAIEPPRSTEPPAAAPPTTHDAPAAPMAPEPVPEGMWSPPTGAPVAEARQPHQPIGENEDADRAFGPTTDEHRLIDLRNRLDLERMAAAGGWRRLGARAGGLRRGGSAS